MKKKKIEKLNINIKLATEVEYNKERIKYIANYKEYEAGGFLSVGEYKSKPDVGEAKWNGLYPEGLKSYRLRTGDKLSSYGQQLVLEKVNELIEVVNKL